MKKTFKGVDQTWVLDPPARMPYDSKYAKVLNRQDNTFNSEFKTHYSII